MSPRPPKKVRGGEQGLSLLEALICLAVISLMAAVLLPLSGVSSIKMLKRAEQNVLRVDEFSAEEKLRIIFRHADVSPKAERAPIDAAGNARVISFEVLAPGATECGAKGRARITLRITTDGDAGILQCQVGAHTTTLMKWREGEARFAYSLDGARWTANLQDVLRRAVSPGSIDVTPFFRAPLVALVREPQSRSGGVIVERIGSSAVIPPDAAGETTT